MRRSLALLLAVALLPFSASAAVFFDTANTRYVTAFDYLAGQGVVQGYQDYSGRPYQFLSRTEALKVLLSMRDQYRPRIEWFRANLPPLALFIDTNQSEWYAPYIETGFESRLITGYPDRTFHPSSALSVEEAIVLLMRTYGLQSTQTSGEWYAESIEQAVTKNLISAEERMYLGQPITRGQFFDMVYRMDTVTKGNLIAFVDPIGALPTVQPVIVAPPTFAATPTVQPDTGLQSAKQFAITIPALNIWDLAVLHPSDPLTSKGLLSPLTDGVGHLFGYPGGGGKVMIYGHSSGYPWDVSQYTKIFRKVNELKQGDHVYVTFDGRLYTYAVSYHETVPANDMESLRGEGEELILYTCWPPDSIKQRYLVHAQLVGNFAQNE